MESNERPDNLPANPRPHGTDRPTWRQVLRRMKRLALLELLQEFIEWISG